MQYLWAKFDRGPDGGVLIHSAKTGEKLGVILLREGVPYFWPSVGASYNKLVFYEIYHYMSEM